MANREFTTVDCYINISRNNKLNYFESGQVETVIF